MLSSGEVALSLESLGHVARHLPNIKEVGLFLNASSDGAQDRIPPCFRELQRLDVGVSRASYAEGLSLHLARMLPPGCLLEYGAPWSDGLTGFETPTSNEFAQKRQEIARRCDTWLHLNDLLPILTKFHCEERRRRQKLESELHAIKSQNYELLSQIHRWSMEGLGEINSGLIGK